jgi:hypothetical protein
MVEGFPVAHAGRPLTTRLWTILLALSALVLLWTAWIFHFMAFRTTY